MEFKNLTDAYRKLGVSYIGNVSHSAKLVHSLSVNVATYGIYFASSNLSGYQACSNDKACRAHCLFSSGHNKLEILAGKHTITNARIKKTKAFFEEREFFVKAVFAEIEKAKAKAEKEGHHFAVRVNCTSDLDIRDFEADGVNICDKFKSVDFYDYTKNPAYLSNAKRYSNLDYTFSYSGYNWDLCQKALESGTRVAVVFDSVLPKRFHGYEVIDGDLSDYRPADPHNVIVGLKFKVTANSIKNNKVKIPSTPFVVTKDNKFCEY